MAQQARASHILVKTEDQANQIMKRIADGEEFDKVARRFSSCPSGKNGGDLGWFGKGMSSALSRPSSDFMSLK
jgi:peptidyl-prolyl cis-trans isomerase C